MKGNMGKILFVDLSNGEIKVETPDETLYRDFIGGYGLGARIIYNRQPGGVDPLGPENILGFGVGPLTGTPAISSGRYVVMGKSPKTGTWGDANSGGYFGPAMKMAGFDAIFFSGISARPVYLWVHDGQAELRDAAHLWGKDSNETEDVLRAELGQKVEVACIGPAGEKLSLNSCVMNNKGRAAARSGLGAVMGSKKLKAVAVLGTLEVPLADKEGAKQVRKKYMAGLKPGNPVYDLFSNLGTCGGTGHSAASGDSPVKNWDGVGVRDFSNGAAISDVNVIKYQTKKYACWQCPLACGGHLKVTEGPYAVETHKPEYETLCSFGTLCLNDNVESLIKANDICNRYGLDTISAGATIAFAIECYENGLITKEDTGGIELTWGNHEAIIAMLEKVARREGFGDVLADGTRVAAEKIGKGAEQYAIHVHGEEVAMHDPRFSPGFTTSYRLNPTPGRHTQGGTGLGEMGFPPQGLGIAPYDKYQYSGKGEAQRILDNYVQVVNASGVCLFGALTIDAHAVPEFMTAVTGEEWALEQLLEAGERIQNLRAAFNLREGLKPIEFKVPERITGHPPLEEGPLAEVRIDTQVQEQEYLEAMGWDPATGGPTKESLLKVGLDDVAQDLFG